MYNREIFRKILLVTAHGFCQIFLCPLLQIIIHAVFSDQDRQSDFRHHLQKHRVVFFCNEPARRQIPGFSLPRIIKIHRHDGNPFGIKQFSVNPHPVSQFFTRFIMEENSGFLHFFTRCLADNQDLRLRVDLKNRRDSSCCILRITRI